jgi:hypothetical protein
MRLDRYKAKFNAAKTNFTFISEGPKGNIPKGVNYTKMKIKGYKNLYNLSFGDRDPTTGEIDDLVVTDNQDRDKILATIFGTVRAFLKNHPNAQVFLTGSTPVRTRLYRMAIGKYLEELDEYFDIQGYTRNGWVSYEKNTAYVAFLVKLKTINYEI